MRDPFYHFDPLDPILGRDRFPYNYPIVGRTNLPDPEMDKRSEEMEREMAEHLSKSFDFLIGKLKKAFKISR